MVVMRLDRSIPTAGMAGGVDHHQQDKDSDTIQHDASA